MKYSASSSSRLRWVQLTKLFLCFLVTTFSSDVVVQRASAQILPEQPFFDDARFANGIGDVIEISWDVEIDVEAGGFLGQNFLCNSKFQIIEVHPNEEIPMLPSILGAICTIEIPGPPGFMVLEILSPSLQYNPSLTYRLETVPGNNIFGIIPQRRQLQLIPPEADTTVNISLAIPPSLLGDAVMNEDGSFQFLFDVPTNTPEYGVTLCSKYFEMDEFNEATISFSDRNCSFTWLSSVLLEVDFVGLGVPIKNSYGITFLAPTSIRQLGELSGAFTGGPGSRVVFNDGNIDNEYQLVHPGEISICLESFFVEVVTLFLDANYPLAYTYFFSIDLNGENTLYFNQTDEPFFEVPVEELFNKIELVKQAPFVSPEVLTLTVVVASSPGPFGEPVELITLNALNDILFVNSSNVPIYVDGITEGETYNRLITDTIQFDAKIDTLSSLCRSGLGGTTGNNQLFSYQWEVLFSSTSVASITSKTLIITPSLLFPATFTVNLLVTPLAQGNSLTSSSTFFFLNIAPVPIVVVIEGGSKRTIETGKQLILDAKRSCDPNVKPLCDPILGYTDLGALVGLNDAEMKIEAGLDPGPEGYFFEWSCKSCNRTSDIFVNASSTTDAVITIPSLPVGEHVIRYNISGFGFAFAEQTIVVIEAVPQCFFPAISLVGPSILAPNEGMPLVLNAQVSGFNANPDLSLVTLEWTADQALLDTVSQSRLLFPSLQIPPLSLVGGNSYTVKLTATSPCPSGDRSVESLITLHVNSAPKFGVLSVVPTSGIAGKTIFTLQTSNWDDLEGDLPLSFSFEYLYRPAEDTNDAPNVEYLKTETNKLLGATSGFIRTTPLPQTPVGQKLVIISIAKDIKGAESRRLASNSFAGVVVTNPFTDENGIVKVTEVTDFNITKEIQDLILIGSEDDIPGFCNSFASSLNQINEQNLVYVNAAANIRKGCINAVVDIVESLETQQIATPEAITRVLTSLDSLTQISNQLEENICLNLVSRIDEIINATEKTLSTLKSGQNDPFAGSRIPGSFSPTSVRTLSNIFECLLNFTQTEQVCNLVGRVRSSLETLARIENSVVASGAESVEFFATNLGFSATRQDSNAIGNQLSNLPIPGQGSGRQISLPRNLGFNGSQATAVNVVVIRWDRDLRCERISEFLDNVSTSNNTNCSLEPKFDYDGPQANGIGNVLSLDFLGIENANDRFPINDLNEPITIQLDAVLDVDFDYECEDLVGFVICGAYNETTNDWDTSGCTVVSVDATDGSVTCECNHATDYAAWKAFKEDLSFTTSASIDKLSLIASLIVGLLLPLLYLLALCGWIWAHRRDKRDAENIRKTILASLIIHRIMRTNKQRLFFLRLKEHAEEGKHLEKDKGDDRQKEKPKFSCCRRFYLALRYEHSVAGLLRFDPHYSRVQRVSVFLAVIVANLFVASILFELKDADDISFGFLLGIVFFSAIAISIPVKLVVKLLFKTSANPVGSPADVAANLFTLVEKLDKDGSPESPEDRALINAYKQVAIADINVKRAEIEARERQSKQGLRKSLRLLPTPKKNVKWIDIDIDSGNEESVKVKQTDTVETEANINEQEQKLFDARQQWLKAKDDVSAATLSARNHWKEVPTEEAIARIERIRQQKSVLMKLAAIAGDTPSTIGKRRKALMKSYFSYLGWFLVFAFYVAATFYIVRFAALRAQYSENRPQSESYYIIYWLLTASVGIVVSYLIAEPMISLIRYVLLPYCVLSFGANGTSDDRQLAVAQENDDDIDDVEAPTMPHTESTFIRTIKKQGTVGESKEHIFFDVLADLVEAIF